MDIEKLAREAQMSARMDERFFPNVRVWSATDSDLRAFANLILEEAARVLDRGAALSEYDKRTCEHGAQAIRELKQ